MLMTMNRSRSKPEIEFQFGGRSLSQPEVKITQPLIEISSQFGMLIDFDIPKRMPSLKPKPEVDFRLYRRHLEQDAQLSQRPRCRVRYSFRQK